MMQKIGRIGFLGGGKMAQALAKAFIAADLTTANHITASVHPKDLSSLNSFKQIGIDTLTENEPIVDRSDLIFISVKPEIVPSVLSEIQHKSANKLFLSVAMGVTIDKLEKNLANSSRVVRIMPNIPALVRSACSVFVRGSKATEHDASITNTLLKSIGTCEEVDEKLLDPITALSGSGPAYICVLIEALADSAVNMGMPRDLAYRLASQTVIGTGLLVRDSQVHPAQLKDNVTSPAGSTAAGLKALEIGGFRATVAAAVEAATLKCREISQE